MLDKTKIKIIGWNLILLLFFVSSCSIQQRFDRLLAKDPNLINKYIQKETVVTDRDTLIIIDTTVVKYRDSTTGFLRTKDSIRIDTFYHVTEKVNVRVISRVDSVFVTTVVVPDTVTQKNTIITEKKTVTRHVSDWKILVNLMKKHLKELVIFLLIVFLLVSLYYFKFRR